MTDRRLRKLVHEFRSGILAGRPSTLMCFAVCAPLQAYLSMCGVETGAVEVHFAEVNHVYLRLPDGRILDPTADQFGLEPVYLGPLPLIYSTLKARLVSSVRPDAGRADLSAPTGPHEATTKGVTHD